MCCCWIVRSDGLLLRSDGWPYRTYRTGVGGGARLVPSSCSSRDDHQSGGMLPFRRGLRTTTDHSFIRPTRALHISDTTDGHHATTPLSSTRPHSPHPSSDHSDVGRPTLSIHMPLSSPPPYPSPLTSLPRLPGRLFRTYHPSLTVSSAPTIHTCPSPS